MNKDLSHEPDSLMTFQNYQDYIDEENHQKYISKSIVNSITNENF